MSGSSSCVVYQKPNETGQCRIFWIPFGTRYRAWTAVEFYKEFDPALFLPSLRVWPSSDGSGTAVFAIERGISIDDTYVYGPFAMVHRVSDIGPVNVTEVNPKLGTSIYALVVVNMSRPGALQFSRSGQAIVDGIWPGVSKQFTAVDPGLSLHKSPRVRWMWRKDIAGFEDRPVADVHVVYNYHPNGFPGAFLFDDYKISLHFYFDLWTQNGSIAAQAVYYEANVSSGKLKKLVSEIANLSAQLAMWNLNQVGIPNALATINGGFAKQGVVIDDVFLLPGNQSTNGLFMLGNVERAGHTGDDVTIVVQTPIG
jgi:hypothetical protein